VFSSLEELCGRLRLVRYIVDPNDAPRTLSRNAFAKGSVAWFLDGPDHFYPVHPTAGNLQKHMPVAD
jgi:hypothetical protein